MAKTAKKKYRDLEIGEVIEENDQFRDPMLGLLDIDENDPAIGTPVEDTPNQKLMRRPI